MILQIIGEIKRLLFPIKTAFKALSVTFLAKQITGVTNPAASPI